MCAERQELENEVTRTATEKRQAQKLVGAKKPDAAEQQLLSSVETKHNEALRKLQEHDSSIGFSKCGCIR